jgi:acyl-CoA thioester hydrolase
MNGSVEVRVRYAETDQMGRVHHRNYLVWCELGRTTLMREHGVSYARMEREGVMLPVSRVEVEYRGALLYDDLVRIETRVERVRSRDIVFAYRMTRVDDGLVAAVARTTLVSADSTGRPARLPAEVRSVLEALVDSGS